MYRLYQPFVCAPLDSQNNVLIVTIPVSFLIITISVLFSMRGLFHMSNGKAMCICAYLSVSRRQDITCD